ncbi:MAG: hypothetical protein ACXAC8_01410 [Candidatus Hodarchaeales archaeon]
MTSEISKRIEEAKELVRNNCVKKYVINAKKERWVVVGNKREYLVMNNPFWCRCYDFQHRVLSDRISECKHCIAVRIALLEDNYDTVCLNNEEYDFIRSEFLSS